MRRPPNPRVALVCEVCGKTVMLAPSIIAQGRRRCSAECMGISKRRPQQVTCVGCGNVFDVPQSNAGGRKYCSSECRIENLKARIKCEHCGKERRVTPTQLKEGARFCSWECARAVLNKPRPEVLCLQCGQFFAVHPHRAQTAKFCSYSCRSIYHLTHNVYASPTTIEIMLYETLDLLGYDYEPQFAITEARTVTDAYIPSLKAAIYADGTYWHSLPKVVEKDKRVNAKLAELGYSVHRFTEPDLRHDAFEIIRAALGRSI